MKFETLGKKLDSVFGAVGDRIDFFCEERASRKQARLHEKLIREAEKEAAFQHEVSKIVKRLGDNQ